ncbi:TonB-dependent hemoglobin/transferrin/lactoferrin family receptor [Ponticoccus sp. (in: a-proteobacteria)]|uniref:TonB-dependent hemoglobin/transferrin/lactoferrin family receptor n=1 Tax=Ponticoccus sp. (in: a-proteobacteria) TaxID=1925025 RepID=UPI003AB825AB
MRKLALLLGSTMIAGSAAAQDGMSLGTLLLETVFRDSRPMTEAPVAATALDAKDLARVQATDFESLIGDIPGVNIFGGPRGMSQTPSIRGFDDDQIVLRLDGGRLNFGQAHRGRFFIDPELVQRVEVIRGGGSTLYGSGALGGVISIETRDAGDLLKEGQTVGGRTALSYSSNGETIGRSLAAYGDWGAVDAMLFLADRRMGDDLTDGDGNAIGRSAVDLQNGLVKLGFEPNADQRFELSYSKYTDDGLLPPNAASASDPLTDVNREADHDALRLSWDFNPGNSELLDLSVLLYSNRLEITEEQVSGRRLDTTKYTTTGVEVVNRSQVELGVPVELVYGFEAFRDEQEGDRDGALRSTYPNASAETLGVFAEATLGLSDRMDLILGLRHDRYHRDPDDSALDTVDRSFTSPRIGFSYRPTENWQIFGNVSRSFRAPSLSEIYNDGVHFAFTTPFGPGTTGSFVNRFVPNPDLKPETSTQVELGTRYAGTDVFRSGDRLGFSANIYNASVKDYVDQVVGDFSSVSPVFVPPGTLLFTDYTTTTNTDARLWGLEAELDYDAQDWFVKAGLTVNRGERDGGGNLGSIPQDRLTATVGLRPWADWEMGVKGTFAAEQTRLPEGATGGDAWQTADLFATWQPGRGALEGATVRLGVDNLFDTEYTIYPNALPQPGRTFKISTSFTF